jgi:hypothetical protein
MKKIVNLFLALLIISSLNAQRNNNGSHYSAPHYNAPHYEASHYNNTQRTYNNGYNGQHTYNNGQHNYGNRDVVVNRHMMRVISHRGVSVRIANANCFFYHGLYYNSYYSLIYPPFGFLVGGLPYGYWAFFYNGYPYYYYSGIYYDQTSDGNYEVVKPPVGAIVSYLPEDAKIVIIDGIKYYKTFGNVYYIEIIKDNKLMYQVVDK